MTSRRSLMLGLLLLLPGPLAAQTSRERRRTPRRQPRRDIPPPPPPPPEATRGEPAPVPNRDMEGPRRADGTAPRLDPALIDPDEPRVGATRDRNSPQAREDRLLRQPAAGARLRVPFTY